MFLLWNTISTVTKKQRILFVLAAPSMWHLKNNCSLNFLYRFSVEPSADINSFSSIPKMALNAQYWSYSTARVMIQVQAVWCCQLPLSGVRINRFVARWRWALRKSYIHKKRILKIKCYIVYRIPIYKYPMSLTQE